MANTIDEGGREPSALARRRNVVASDKSNRQPTISQFFVPPAGACQKVQVKKTVVEIVGKIQCPFCKEIRFFSPQGYATHRMKHERDGDAYFTGRRAKYGKAKVRDVGAIRNKPEPALVSSPSSTEGSLGNDSPSSHVSNPMDGLEVVEASDAVKEKRSKRRANEISAEDDDEEMDVEPEPQSRARHFKPFERKAILDAWHENKSKEGTSQYMGKAKFCKYIGPKVAHPKFQKTQLNRFLAEEEDIRKSAKVTGKDRRALSVPRQKVGQYPAMEYRLAEYIRSLRSIGLPVETWMVKYESKLILHDLYPQRFSYPEYGDKDYPSRLVTIGCFHSLKGTASASALLANG